MPGECEKAVVRAKRENISMNQGVVKAKEIVTEKIWVKGSKTIQ